MNSAGSATLSSGDTSYYRARYYDAASGRFFSEDPSGPGSGDNLYSYGVNNPVIWNDPFGLQPNDNNCKNKPCSISVTCLPTPNTGGFSHCTVTTQEGTTYTAYDGYASGSVWWSILKVSHGPGLPPGPKTNFTKTIDCKDVAKVAQKADDINNNPKRAYLYSFPIENSNTAAQMLTDAAGVHPSYPWGAWGAYP